CGARDNSLSAHWVF
nr:immunoglobulin light chain junction region [Macaca mulatta]